MSEFGSMFPKGDWKVGFKVLLFWKKQYRKDYIERELVSDNMVFKTGLSLIYLGWYYYILYSGIMMVYNLTPKNSLKITSALVIGLLAFYGIIGIGTALLS